MEKLVSCSLCTPYFEYEDCPVCKGEGLVKLEVGMEVCVYIPDNMTEFPIIGHIKYLFEKYKAKDEEFGLFLKGQVLEIKFGMALVKLEKEDKPVIVPVDFL